MHIFAVILALTAMVTLPAATARAEDSCSYDAAGFQSTLKQAANSPVVRSTHEVRQKVTLDDGTGVEYYEAGCAHYGNGYILSNLRDFPSYDDARFFDSLKNYLRKLPVKEAATIEDIMANISKSESLLNEKKIEWRLDDGVAMLQADYMDYGFSIEAGSSYITLAYQGYY